MLASLSMTIYPDGMMFYYCVSLVSVVNDQTAPRLCGVARVSDDHDSDVDDG